MSEDKTKTLPGEEKTEAELLREELENLRETFQQKLGETEKEMEEMPVIQELEYGEDMTEEDDSEAEEQPEEKKGKAKKKRKVGKIIAITVPAVLLAFIIAILTAYVVISIKNPNLNSCVSAYVMGDNAETYEEKIEYYEKAISFCTDDSSALQNAFKLMALESIVSEMYKEKGYADAYAYMKENMSDEMIAQSNEKAVKEVVSISESVNTFALAAFEAVIKNVGDSKDVPEMSVLSEGLVIPEVIRENGEAILTTIAEGYIYNRSKENLGDSITAVTSYYSSAYNALVTQGADSDKLSQEIACALYHNGLVFESAVFSYVNIDPENTQLSNDYMLIKEELKSFSAVKLDVIGVAEKAISEGKTSKDDIVQLVENELGDGTYISDVLGLMVMSAVEALQAEENKDLNTAGSAYSAIISAQSVVGMDVTVPSLRICKVVLTMGNFEYLAQVYNYYLTEDAISGLSEENKALYDEIKEIYTAYTDMVTVYNEEYEKLDSEAGYEDIKNALLACITDDMSDAEKGFMYLAIADAAAYYGSDDALLYFEFCRELLCECPFLFAEQLLELYIEEEEYVEAGEFAEYLLSCDCSTEMPYCYLAIAARAMGDVDAVIEIAEKGLAVNDTFLNCSYDAAVAYMLKGDIETAFSYISKCYNSSQASIALYDLILIYEASYEGDNEDIINSLKEMKENIDSVYEANGVSSYEDTVAVINGEKTLEEVFLSDNFTLA